VNQDGTNLCVCDPPPPACQFSTPPACDGDCPPGTICQEDTTGKCNCVTLCNQSAPACDGVCPDATQACVHDAVGCHCEPPADEPCQQTYPACDGFCPNPGEICRPDAAGVGCFCDPPPLEPCDATFPTCDGFCPSTTEICVENPPTLPPGCHCEEPPPKPCDATYPTCDGFCPNMTDICVENTTGTPGCHCEPPPPPLCENQPFPTCGGICPVGQNCKAPFWYTVCKCCPRIVPPPVDDVIFVSRTKIKWTPWPSPCALWNVYVKTAVTLTDSDHDGVADDYGTCHDSGLTVAEAQAPGDPAPNETHYIIVTAESYEVGEGSMGAASNGLARPNLSPCPTPP
jgi:hypothetical protein